MRALILDSGADRGSLAAARALARDGWFVGNGSPKPTLCARSRAVGAHHVVPPVSDGASAFVAAVADAVRDGSYEVVFCSDDSGVLTLSERRDEVGAVVPYGPHEGVIAAFDKLELTRRAALAGLGVPPSATPEEIGRLASGSLVVKPRLTFAVDRESRIDARLVADREAARAACEEIAQAGGEAFIQERIDGSLMAVTALRDRAGQIAAILQQVSDLTWPAGVGVSARAHTVTPSEELVSGVSALLASLQWVGLAQLQFLLDRQGTPRLLDFNGRFYGSLALAQAAGLNLPASWARIATGRPIPAGTATAEPGAVYQWFSRDVRAGAAAGGGRLRGLTGALATAPRATHSVWSSTDPSVAFGHYGRQLASALADRLRS